VEEKGEYVDNLPTGLNRRMRKQGHSTTGGCYDKIERKQRGTRKGIFPSTCAQIQKIKGPLGKVKFLINLKP
jgi:hypothetical protein